MIYKITVFDDGLETLQVFPNKWFIVRNATHQGVELKGKVVIQNVTDPSICRTISFWKLAEFNET